VDEKPATFELTSFDDSTAMGEVVLTLPSGSPGASFLSEVAVLLDLVAPGTQATLPISHMFSELIPPVVDFKLRSVVVSPQQ